VGDSPSGESPAEPGETPYAGEPVRARTLHRIFTLAWALPVEYTTRFITATGERVERDVGYAIVHAEEARTSDEVVFAQPGDMTVLGARSLEGLNLRVDSRNKRLVPAGPLLAGAIP
jgi:hypothetical protein